MLPIDTTIEQDIALVSTGPAILDGTLNIPANASTIAILINGHGSMKHEIAEPFATRLNSAGIATLCIDLLTAEEQFDSRMSHFSRDARFQSGRIRDIVNWLRENPSTHDLSIAAVAGGGAGTGLLRAASAGSSVIGAIVVDASIQPNEVPQELRVPTLLLMQDDAVDIRRAQTIAESLRGPVTLRILSSIDAARAIRPIFSDAAGVIAAEWLSTAKI